MRPRVASCTYSRPTEEIVHSDRAIVLRKYRLTESSLIVELLTEHHGKLRAVAKGALKQRNRFAGVLDLFYLLEVKAVSSRRSELYALADAVLVEPWRGIGASYKKTAVASYFVRLLSQSLADEAPVGEVFQLVYKALDFLSANTPSQSVVERFEVRLAELLGLPGAGEPPHLVLAEHIGRSTLPERDELLQILAES